MEGLSQNVHILNSERSSCGQHHWLPTTALFPRPAKLQFRPLSSSYPSASGKTRPLLNPQLISEPREPTLPCKSSVRGGHLTQFCQRGRGGPSKGFLCFLLFLSQDIPIYEHTGWSSGSCNRTVGEMSSGTNQTPRLAKRKKEMHLGLPLINAQTALPLDFWFTRDNKCLYYLNHFLKFFNCFINI